MVRRHPALALIALAVVMCLAPACGRDGDLAAGAAAVRHMALDPEDEATLETIAFAPWAELDWWVKGRGAEGVCESERIMRQGALHCLALRGLSADQWRRVRKVDPWVDRRLESFEQVREDTLARIRMLQTGQATPGLETAKGLIHADHEMRTINRVAEQAGNVLGEEWAALLQEVGSESR